MIVLLIVIRRAECVSWKMVPVCDPGILLEFLSNGAIIPATYAFGAGRSNALRKL